MKDEGDAMREVGKDGASKKAARKPKERRGEFAEAAFLMQITERGWVISQPFGHKQGYDFVVDNGRDLLRVQVKSTEVASSKYRARVTLGRGNQSKTPYQPWEVDFSRFCY